MKENKKKKLKNENSRKRILFNSNLCQCMNMIIVYSFINLLYNCFILFLNRHRFHCYKQLNM